VGAPIREDQPDTTLIRFLGLLGTTVWVGRWLWTEVSDSREFCEVEVCYDRLATVKIPLLGSKGHSYVQIYVSN